MTAYYNEIDPYAAQWLRNLIAAGYIAPGDVDERSIVDVRADDLRGYTQCHFFAGIGVWSYALRLAGWPDTRPVWTGSCPCQPFSASGGRSGFADKRHLWPHWHHLISICGPERVYGEQVASKDGLAWLDLVQSDMEGENYAFAAIDTCSAGVGAPHIRQRLRFVAYRDNAIGRPSTAGRHQRDGEDTGRPEGSSHFEGRGRPRELANSPSIRGGTGLRDPGSTEIGRAEPANLGAVGELADCNGRDASAEGLQRSRQHRQRPEDGLPVRSEHRGIGHNGGPELERPGPVNGYWRSADWIFCRDGRWRPVEPGTFPLAHGAPARVGRLRAYGNAVDAEATCDFIAASEEAICTLQV